MSSSKDTILNNWAVLGLTWDNPSQAAMAQLLAQGIGDFMDVVRTEMVNTKNSITSVIVNQRFGDAAYYTTAARAFQLGDDLVPLPPFFNPGYITIDASKQIIKQAAFQNNQGDLSLKIATADLLTGLLQQVPANQLSDFKSYFVNFQIPGLPVTVISLPANIFSFSSICTYNSGYNLSTLQTNIKASMLAFAGTFPFNGVLYADQLSDYVKANVPGIVDFYITNTTIDGGAFVGTTLLTAGYFNYIANITDLITYNAING